MIFFLLLLFATINLCGCDTHNPQGQIILLNGPSTAGKSTLAYILQATLPGIWHYHHKNFYEQDLVTNVRQAGLVDSNFIYKNIPHLFKTVRRTIAKSTHIHKITHQTRWARILCTWNELFYIKMAY